jgi:hypothetical protein
MIARLLLFTTLLSAGLYMLHQHREIKRLNYEVMRSDAYYDRLNDFVKNGCTEP